MRAMFTRDHGPVVESEMRFEIQAELSLEPLAPRSQDLSRRIGVTPLNKYDLVYEGTPMEYRR
jgi:hypothetical protein